MVSKQILCLKTVNAAMSLYFNLKFLNKYFNDFIGRKKAMLPAGLFH